MATLARSSTLTTASVLASFRNMPHRSDTAEGFWVSVMHAIGNMSAAELKSDFRSVVQSQAQAWDVETDRDAKRLYRAMMRALD